jgi:hypothetical protein
LLNDYSDQQQLCQYLRQTQHPTRREWAAAWTSHHRHYGAITTSPIEGMHKVLKDYLMTSKGDLLRVVGRIEQMVKNQYNKYRKDIASSKHSIKFKHTPASTPLLPPGLHDILTKPAIERIWKQDQLQQKEQRQLYRQPCSGLFEKTYGLPCRHTIQELKDSGQRLSLNYPYDDHWCYQREQGPSIRLSPRPHRSIQEPLPALPRGFARRNEASTRRDPSAFERPIPPSIPRPQPLQQSQGQNPSSTLQPVNTSVTVSVPTSITAIAPVTTSVSVTIPDTVSLPISTPSSSPVLSHISLSPPLSITVSVTVARTPPQSPPQQSTLPQSSPQPAWQPPSLEEFLADIEYRWSEIRQPELNMANMSGYFDYLKETAQQGDPPKLIEARRMALDTIGLFADCTPTMAWNFHFGSMEAFHRERQARLQAQNGFLGSLDTPRPKRVAAATASDAWIGLSSRKRQRRQ